MDKKKNIGIILVHLFWALSWSVGVYYVEYGIMMLFANSGVDRVISANAAVGAVLFLVFYLLERKLVEEELTKSSLFVVSSYIIPILFQGIMIYWIGHYFTGDESVFGIIFIFTFILLVMGLFFRAMLEVVNFYRNHIRVKRTKL